MARIQARFAGVPPMGGNGGTPPAEGVYPFVIKKLEDKNGSRAGQVNCFVHVEFSSVEEGDNADGYETRRCHTYPDGAGEKKDRAYIGSWRTLLLALGFTDEQIDDDNFVYGDEEVEE